MSDSLQLLRQILDNIAKDVSSAQLLVKEMNGESEEDDISNRVMPSRSLSRILQNSAEVVEGVFDGQKMIGPDGKSYSIPVNYASKSKLVEGDLLKLTIEQDGRFLFKQIGPVERIRTRGILISGEGADDFKVLADGKKYCVLTASVTYFRGEVGDEVVILLPKDGDAMWASVDNMIKQIDSHTGDNTISEGNGLDNVDDVSGLEDPLSNIS